MIVRNEAAILERCLDAALPAFDAASICDTGSTDGTAALAAAWLARRAIPGRVHAHAFEDFGRNRTLSILAAQKTLAELGWRLESCYLLFLDADMVLEVGERFRRDTLEADVYRVIQRNGTLEYPNVRLARASLAARFVGPTHEYFDAPPNAGIFPLDTLSIDDRGDGGSRSDKFERDRRLLEAELAQDPQNARAMFYLAQTLRDLGDFPKALFWYRRRLTAGGWPEEAWYAQYAIGRLYIEAGQTADAVRELHRAIHGDPSRAEPFFHLARHLRNRGRHLYAAACARHGLEIGFPADRGLFIERDVYDWGLDEELAISGFYTRFREEGFAANERLALTPDIPARVSNQALANAAFYAEPLSDATYMRITPALPPDYRPCNPSIVRNPSGYLLNCRAVSYRVDAHQRYVAVEPDGTLRTRNFLMLLDRDLGFLDQTEVVSDLPPLRPSTIIGLEDCRLVELSGRIAFTCTTIDLHPDGPVRPSLVTLDDRFRIERHVPLRGHGGGRPEKNWLPFTDAQTGELRAVYGYEPFVVLGIDPSTGDCQVVAEHRSRRNLRGFRGSAGPVDLPAEAGGGKLLLVHEVAFHGRRYYLHRFVAVDERWRITRASRPFFFRTRGIEFVCGAALAHGGEDLLITLGVEDGEAWLCRLPLRAVASLLRPLPESRRSNIFPGNPA
ncbi:MAG: hypothetical protein ACRD1B_02855 [Thermoanaerobaculia bacterium]